MLMIEGRFLKVPFIASNSKATGILKGGKITPTCIHEIEVISRTSYGNIVIGWMCALHYVPCEFTNKCPIGKFKDRNITINLVDPIGVKSRSFFIRQNDRSFRITVYQYSKRKG